MKQKRHIKLPLAISQTTNRKTFEGTILQVACSRKIYQAIEKIA